ncbi:MAG TPA: hypothetical protein VMV10_26180 [Pirellulales bacterium]|nr:hypothetical protein [Pirellulales bacterium]
MTIRLLVAGVLAASIAVLTLRAEEKPSKEQSVSFWMQKKLEYSQKILAGLAEADYDSIAANAKAMNQLSHIEEFVRGRDEQYRHHLKTFDHVTHELARQAQEENIDGAALAYMELTLNCVNCHKHLRDRKESDSEQ